MSVSGCAVLLLLFLLWHRGTKELLGHPPGVEVLGQVHIFDGTILLCIVLEVGGPAVCTAPGRERVEAGHLHIAVHDPAAAMGLRAAGRALFLLCF